MDSVENYGRRWAKQWEFAVCYTIYEGQIDSVFGAHASSMTKLNRRKSVFDVPEVAAELAELHDKSIP